MLSLTLLRDGSLCLFSMTPGTTTLSMHWKVCVCGKCLVSACAMFFVSVPSAPPSCSHLSWEGCKCPKRPQRISRHDRWRGSITRGMGLAYLYHQCWARRSHKQRWKNKNRYKMKRMEVLGWWSLGRSWQLAELANCSLRQGDRVRENWPWWLCLFD